MLSLLLVIAVGAGLVVSLVLNATLSGMAATLGGTTGLYLLERIGTLVLLAGLCALLFRVLPDTSVEWADVWIGSLGTAVLISAGTSGMAWYLSQATVASAYGAAGALAALLIWIYYAAQIFFLGAEFTSVYANHRRQGAASSEPESLPASSEPPSVSPQPRQRWPARIAWIALGMLIAFLWRR